MTALHTAILSLVLAGSAVAIQTQTPPAAKPAADPKATTPAAKQDPNAKPAPEGAPAADPKAFSVEQLEQLAAPIALYPDSLLAQLLIAATYPLEIVEAARWQQKNAKLKGEALEKELQQVTWDPSVKSLTGFADVLKRMNDNLDWTQDLGDAFLGQKKELMDAVQAMRRKAYDSGNLKSSKELTVKQESDKIIVIEAADPEVIYVPTYYPSAVYGSWGYPYYYYPPMYPPPPAGGAWFGFSVGVIWGAAIWGDCNWGGSDVDIDIDNQNNFIDRTENGDRRQQTKDRARTKDGKFNHDPSHRKGVGYKDSKTAQRFGGSQGQNRVTRDQARGYGDRGGASASTRPSAGTGARPGAGNSAGTRPSAGNNAGTRPGGGSVPSQRPSGAGTSRPGGGTTPATRPSTGASTRQTGSGGGSFTGSRGSSSSTRASSARGSASRGSAGARGGGRGGGGRGGGGRR